MNNFNKDYYIEYIIHSHSINKEAHKTNNDFDHHLNINNMDINICGMSYYP